MSKPFRLVPIGGLCNRVRAILSYRAVHGAIEVLWARSSSVSGGTWEDAFGPLEGVSFTDIGTGHAHDYAGEGLIAYAQVAPEAPVGWAKGYADLIPPRAVQRRMGAVLARTGDVYYAVHARRGDHAAHAPKFGHFTTNEELLEWVLERDDRWPWYLATDDPSTRAWFARVKRPIVGSGLVGAVGGYEQRAGTLEDAAVDLFVCTDAALFKGCWMSSFSETIELLRCNGDPAEGFRLRRHMPSADAEWYRGRPDRYEEWRLDMEKT
jgi:hypothetical protein